MNPKWYDAIYFMVYDDKSVPEIAKELGVSHTTVYKWRVNEDFQKELQKELDRKVSILRNKFKKDVDKVYDRVYKIAVHSDDEPTSLRAGTFLLEQVMGKAGNTIDINAKQDVSMKVESKDILSVFDKKDK